MSSYLTKLQELKRQIARAQNYLTTEPEKALLELENLDKSLQDLGQISLETVAEKELHMSLLADMELLLVKIDKNKTEIKQKLTGLQQGAKAAKGYGG